jgi:phosphonate transport system substrate-binding protein
MAENSESFCQAVACYIEKGLGIRTEYVTGIPWQERERLFDRGEIQILWLCGYPYVHKVDMAESDIELLAVPVPRGERYRGRPVYFSDVIVRRERPFQSFLDLRGASWAYNEPRSHSGFNVVRSHLAGIAPNEDFFGEIVESGAHTGSLEMTLSRRVDCAAIDSTVLEWLIAGRSALPEQIRVIESLGPSPMPPWVISRKVAASLRGDVRNLLLCMHGDVNGGGMLARAGLERFVEAQDHDYDPIRAMARKAEQFFRFSDLATPGISRVSQSC